MDLGDNTEQQGGHTDASFPIELTTVNGDRIVLNPPVRAEDEVMEIQRRVAATLSVHYKQIAFIYGAQELDYTKTIQEELGSVVGTPLVTVLKQVCQIRPSDYESYIDFKARGWLEVDEIQYPSWYPADFTENGYQDARPSTDPERIAYFYADSEESRGWKEAITFPQPTDININMMPFIIGEKDSIPEAYHSYWPLIEKCAMPSSEHFKVGYLTIHESMVKKGQTQRRAGLHIECPGNMPKDGSVYHEKRYYWGCGIIRMDRSYVEGGIYMASNVPNSCKIWDLRIKDPASVVGKLGNLEHLRDSLGEGTVMEAGKLYWITDTTPHESLPMEEDTYRQFFRLVSSELSAWYPENATANPLGIEPDPDVTKTVPGDKFEG